MGADTAVGVGHDDLLDEPDWESGLPADHTIEVTVTDNPVVATLYGPDGSVLIELHERPPIGFRVP